MKRLVFFSDLVFDFFFGYLHEVKHLFLQSLFLV